MDVSGLGLLTCTLDHSMMLAADGKRETATCLEHECPRHYLQLPQESMTLQCRCQNHDGTLPPKHVPSGLPAGAFGNGGVGIESGGS
jgi:hypothetical protein